DCSSDVCSSDLVLRPLRDLGVEVVHQHPERGLLRPALAGALRAARRAHHTGTGDRHARPPVGGVVLIPELVTGIVIVRVLVARWSLSVGRPSPSVVSPSRTGTRVCSSRLRVQTSGPAAGAGSSARSSERPVPRPRRPRRRCRYRATFARVPPLRGARASAAVATAVPRPRAHGLRESGAAPGHGRDRPAAGSIGAPPRPGQPAAARGTLRVFNA